MSNKVTATRAIIRQSSDGKAMLVLCHIGHLIESHDLKEFAGSMFESELGTGHAGDRFDRRAAKCSGTGHT